MKAVKTMYDFDKFCLDDVFDFVKEKKKLLKKHKKKKSKKLNLEDDSIY